MSGFGVWKTILGLLDLMASEIPFLGFLLHLLGR